MVQTIPDNVDDIAQAALRLRDQDDPEAGAALLQNALRQHPNEPLLWQCLGLVERAMQHSVAAAEALQRAARLDPDNGRIIHALARVTLEAGWPALELFDEARALLPHDASVLIGRSAAQLAQGDIAAAIHDLEQACQRQPDWLDGHNALADLKWLHGEEDSALASYQHALAASSAPRALWHAMIRQCIKVERFDWADALTRDGIHAMGESEEFLAFAAICASETGDIARADGLFARIFSNQAALQDTDLAVRGTRHLLRCGRPEQAVILAQTAINRADSAKMWPYLGVAWRLVGDERWRWLETDERLVRRVMIYQPHELAPLADCLRALHTSAHEPAGQSVRIGSQTDGPLFARAEPEIADLRQRIENAVAAHIAALGPPLADHPTLSHRPRKVRFAGSWSVRLQGAGHHSNHIHPQGWLSSALYISVPQEAQSGPAPAGYLQLGVPPAELGLDLAPTCEIAPQPGWLTLFPSIMWHGTRPIADGERMTVAFDVRP